MTNQQLKDWRMRLGWTQLQAAEALGISVSMLGLYETGKRYEDDRPVEIPRTVVLACAYLAERLMRDEAMAFLEAWRIIENDGLGDSDLIALQAIANRIDALLPEDPGAMARRPVDAPPG